MENIKLNITGMTCTACSARIEKNISKIEGIKEIHVNLAMDSAEILYDGRQIDAREIISSIEKTGYGAAVEGVESDDIKVKEEKKLRNLVIISMLLSSPLLAGMAFMIAGIDFTMLQNPYVQLACAAPVQFIIGWRFYRNAFHGLRNRSPGMDLLVAMGTSAAFFYSIYNGFIRPLTGGTAGDLYFEASAVIITLVLLGKYFEARAKGKTSESIKKLLDLQPDSAVIIKDGSQVTVSSRELSVGDVIAVKPGERIPADGEIISGDTAVNESMISGESMPVEKGPGSGVTGGTVNTFGAFTFRALRVGRDTYLSEIARIVELAQTTKPPIQRIADRVAAVFVPAVLLAALITFLAWFFFTGNVEMAIVSSVAVMVISCPCALGLATPTAVMVGSGVGAEMGILFRSGEALEKTSSINSVVLDKTGTVTEGTPAVADVRASDSKDSDELLYLAGVLEKKSEHPLGKAIYEKAVELHGELPDPEEFTALPGKGIKAVFQGKEMLAGTGNFLEEMGVDITAMKDIVSGIEKDGKSPVYLAEDKILTGIVVLADKIKKTTPGAVRELKSLGIDVSMITGDNEGAARYAAEKAGIDTFTWGVLPENKAREINIMQESGKIVAMAGDGINDSPALAAADVGFAVGSGTDVAIESSDITLVHDDLRDIAAAVRLSQRTIRKIKENFFWAFIYNIIGIPIAAMGFLNPVIAGAAMAFSSVSVVTNSLLLKRFLKKESRQAG